MSSDWFSKRSEVCKRTDKMDSSRINFGEMLFQFIAQIGSFLFRSLSIFMFGRQFLLNVHESDVKNGRYVNAYLSRAGLYRMHCDDASIYQQIEKSHYDK